MNLNPLFIFDMDGTLIDMCQIHRDAFKRALFEITGRTLKPDEEVRLEGLPTKEKCRRLGLSDHYISLVNSRKQLLTDFEAIKPNPKVQEALLKAATLGEVVVYSNSIERTVERALKAAGLFHLVDCYFGNDSAAITKPKPSPQGYKAIMDLFCASPESTIIYEDSPAGIEAAVGSGAKVFIITEGNLVRPQDISDPLQNWDE